jgi:hypothetical protein
MDFTPGFVVQRRRLKLSGLVCGSWKSVAAQNQLRVVELHPQMDRHPAHLIPVIEE